ncbi:hypothetical protein [Lentzea aerocolonigenes]|uniref:hypothetical protein n=1 Tax=Lentzea aerocolonigenes TaxID=68170 RepID=UPI001F472E5A|nr:hypothetical protein [Lentzea aerocolonigenes]
MTILVDNSAETVPSMIESYTACFKVPRRSTIHASSGLANVDEVYVLFIPYMKVVSQLFLIGCNHHLPERASSPCRTGEQVRNASANLRIEVFERLVEPAETRSGRRLSREQPDDDRCSYAFGCAERGERQVVPADGSGNFAVRRGAQVAASWKQGFPTLVHLAGQRAHDLPQKVVTS